MAGSLVETIGSEQLYRMIKGRIHKTMRPFYFILINEVEKGTMFFGVIIDEPLMLNRFGESIEWQKK